MKTINEQQHTCECGEAITLREYAGMEGGWYSDHHCEAHLAALERADRRDRLMAALNLRVAQKYAEAR